VANDTYLVISYGVALSIVVASGRACIGVLRGSFLQLTNHGANVRFARLLKTCFPLGLMLPVLTGFLSVSFVSCSRSSYGEIVADRAYLVQKNQEQLLTSLYWLLGALAVWSLVCAVVLAYGRRHHETAPRPRGSEGGTG